MCTTPRRYCQWRPGWCGVSQRGSSGTSATWSTARTPGAGAGARASLQCSGDQLLRGEVSEDSLHRQHPGLALAQLDMDSRTVAPEHTELVAGLRGLLVASGDILRVVQPRRSCCPPSSRCHAISCRVAHAC